MESAFQFSNPSLTKMEFCINEDFENGRDKEVKMAVNMGIQIESQPYFGNWEKGGIRSVLCVCNRNGGIQMAGQSEYGNDRKIIESKCPVIVAGIFETHYFTDYGSIAV